MKYFFKFISFCLVLNPLVASNIGDGSEEKIFVNFVPVTASARGISGVGASQEERDQRILSNLRQLSFDVSTDWPAVQKVMKGLSCEKFDEAIAIVDQKNQDFFNSLPQEKKDQFKAFINQSEITALREENDRRMKRMVDGDYPLAKLEKEKVDLEDYLFELESSISRAEFFLAHLPQWQKAAKNVRAEIKGLEEKSKGVDQTSTMDDLQAIEANNRTIEQKLAEFLNNL